ncbi:MAG: tetratricopeptide repeat protein [Ramlibacter sp.]
MAMRILRIVLLALAAFGLTGLALAQSEPTIKQIYDTAQSGQVDKARQMAQDVLRNHPKSAKAHFVMAQLDAAQGRTAEAREQLSQAESFAPGLPFARPEAVQALRSKLSAKPALRDSDYESPAVAAPVRDAPRSSFPWGWILLGAVGLAVVATVMRSRAAARSAPVDPNNYGAPSAGDWGRQPAGYGPQPYGPAPAQPGMGGNIMGGLATGLAIGAGALAAEEIGRRMLGSHEQHNLGSGATGPVAHPQSDSSLARDAGIGDIDRLTSGGSGPALPDDFGINDAGSWDDGGGSFGGGDGGGWDS